MCIPAIWQRITRHADLVVSAAVLPGLIGAEHIRAGAVVIGVSIIRTPDGLVGDVDRAAVAGKACITHVPDGVGPVTTAAVPEGCRRGHRPNRVCRLTPSSHDLAHNPARQGYCQRQHIALNYLRTNARRSSARGGVNA